MSVVKEGPGIKARANILDSEALEAQLSILQLFLPIAGWLVGRQDGESYTLLATRGVFGDFSPQALDSLLEKEWCECAQVAGFQYRCATDTEHIFLPRRIPRSEEHTSELQSLMRISYAVFCLKQKKHNKVQRVYTHNDSTSSQ